MSAAGWTISVIAILIVVVLAWNTLGGREDWEALRRRWRRRG